MDSISQTESTSQVVNPCFKPKNLTARLLFCQSRCKNQSVDRLLFKLNKISNVYCIRNVFAGSSSKGKYGRIFWNEAELLLHQYKFLRVRETSGLHATEVHTTRHIRGIPLYLIRAGLFRFVDQRCNFLAENIIQF